jgi:hypothetical protein
MPDIREVLKGLSVEDRAVYMETRNVMRRAYLAAHARVLPIDRFEIEDDQFLDLIDIKLATLFDRGGMFDNAKGSIDTEQANEAEKSIESAATRLMRGGNTGNAGKINQEWPTSYKNA